MILNIVKHKTFSIGKSLRFTVQNVGLHCEGTGHLKLVYLITVHKFDFCICRSFPSLSQTELAFRIKVYIFLIQRYWRFLSV
jgi:hypothetical protein